MKRMWKFVGVLTACLVGLFVMISNHSDAPAAPPSPDTIVHTDSSAGKGGGTVFADDDNPSIAFNSQTFPSVITPLVSPSTGIARKSMPPPRTAKTVVIQNKEYPVYTYEAFLTPNDPQANQSWVTNARLPQYWDLPVPTNEVTIAIIDTGFGLAHEEFTNRWDTNLGETGSVGIEALSRMNCTDRGLALNASCNLIDDNGDLIVDNESGSVSRQNHSFLNCTDQGRPLDKSCNQIDDDGNGYVDDALGWDFVNYDNSVQAGQTNPAGTGTTHGTMVAGVAAATGNNAKGIAGVNWQAKILPIQALDDDSYGDSLTVGNSIYYAIARGADVINLSLGTPLSDTYVREAVEAATQAGIIVVAASGNDGCNCISYPAQYGEAIAVGALTSTNVSASFSSYGSELDLMAPGTGIYTTTWTAGNQVSAYASNVAGTSFSSPIVAGIAAAIKARQPNSTSLQVVGVLTEKANRSNIPATPIQTARYGYGSLDAHAAALRSQSVRNVEQSYIFSPLTNGIYTNNLMPTQDIGSQLVYYCQDQIPTTPIYEMIKGGSRLYTISRTEQRRNIALGYNSSLFAYTCINQPQDITSVYRTLDISREFRNIYTK